MAQTSVKSFYNTRKRFNDPVKEIGDFKGSQTLASVREDSLLILQKAQLTKTSKEVNNEKRSVDMRKRSSLIPERKEKIASKKGNAKNSNKQSANTKTSKNDKTKQTTVTAFYSSRGSSVVSETQISQISEESSRSKLQNDQKEILAEIKCKTEATPENPAASQKGVHESASVCNSEETNNLNVCSKDTEDLQDAENKTNLTRSPKRVLPLPIESTPTKKKVLTSSIIQTSKTENIAHPACTSTNTKNNPVRRKLDLGLSLSPSKVKASLHSPIKSQMKSPRKMTSPVQDKLNAVIDQSRAKLLLSPRIGELRKSLESFSRKTSIIKEYESNPYKINTVITPTKTPGETSALPTTLAHERFSYLVSSDSLVLPYKYKLLSEMFRSLDTVVSILNNRKEKITFEKVRDGVQKMMKRSFSKTHLAQIISVLPSAYNLSIEKCGFMNKKPDSHEYQLIITPCLETEEGKKKKKSKSSAFSPMHPQCLIDRRNRFHSKLLEITKTHHQNFLERLNFPSVPEDRLKRWHPKFAVDSVPDIQPVKLPEPQELKIHTAKDVLNKIRGISQTKVGKALQSVADESKGSNLTIELTDISSPKTGTSTAALKGICTDLLAKVRARESAKLLESMTRTPEETKRLAKLERLPKIVNILWHYFIAERKAAVPIDVAIEKIIHSFNSLTTPDDVKDHLKLITETFPGWLSFVEIPKGVYIVIDKERNINEMLENFKY